MTSLAPKSNVRERVLLVGGAGSGKSSSWLSIARKCPDSHLCIIDTDFAADRMLDGKALANVTAELATDWDDLRRLTREFSAAMKPNDWLVIDFISSSWEMVQGWYIEKRYGKSAEDYFLQHALAAKKGNALEGDTDWGIINKQYRAWTTDLLKAPGHLLGTSPAKPLGDRDGAETKQMWGTHGFKPEGQKHRAHLFHSVLVTGKTRTGEWTLSTIKDRERRELDKAVVSDFATSYLLAVAGWRPSAS